jgi:transcription-repair coupling factor (superfamily II helicase)
MIGEDDEMPLDSLLMLFDELGALRKVIHKMHSGIDSQVITGVSNAQKSLIIGNIYRKLQGPMCVVTYSSQQAEKIVDDLVSLLPNESVVLFPAIEILAHEESRPSRELLVNRAKVFESIYKGEQFIVVVPVKAIIEKMIPKKEYFRHVMTVEKGQNISFQSLTEQLVDMGYDRTDMVDEKGQFSVRGGLIDIFPLTLHEPVRIEFFGDEIDLIRTFDPDTQRSRQEIESCFIMPAREFILPPERLQQGLELLQSDLKTFLARFRKADKVDEEQRLEEKITSAMEKLAERVYFDGISSYKPYFYQNLEIFLDYLDSGALLILDEFDRMCEYVKNDQEERGERYLSLLDRGEVLPRQFENYLQLDEVVVGLDAHRRIFLSLLEKSIKGVTPSNVVSIPSSEVPGFHGHMGMFIEKVCSWKNSGKRIMIALSAEDKVSRVWEALLENDIGAVSLFRDNPGTAFNPHMVAITQGYLQSGFDMPSLDLIVLTDIEVFGRQKNRQKRKSSKQGSRISSYLELSVGDYVVHENHGIGKYLGIESMTVAGIKKDFLVVRYAGEDTLYVPAEQANLLQKYIGTDDTAPKLYKLGSSDWVRVKRRVRESVQELAEDLLQLYAKRQATPGFAFSPDTIWQKEFEDAFQYEETPDQWTAIEEIKRDMESSKPMDRLLCGDVGYGKTEVAMRAAFKAVMDNKQVGILVPTTILAQQHYVTFCERFKNYPFTIKVLSRFQSRKEQREIIKGLKQGTVDIVIGTHRLVQPDVGFRDLGLVIIDEEQRFGVSQKERLKILRTTTDVLSLSATPIPRTLHMSLVGVRDMSAIETPPEDRFPVRTYVLRYNENVISEAIHRELQRNGQVFFVSNRVNNIERVAFRLQELVPAARIAIAHGQMHEDRLEKVMLQFMAGEYDVLVCTTIVENGLDIANANTLIVIDSDKMGLAQLYQLRGRVGRTNRLAYAYFMYSSGKILSEDAERRLQAIKEFTDLGSGFKVAMRDLEIRGSGNLLGPEQHGHIAAVGFELYCKLLEEAIRSLKGETVTAEEFEPSVELNVSAYISDGYIGDARQKIEMYKKIVAVKTLDDAKDIEEEIRDRFGDLPKAVKNLLAIARIKVLAKEVGITLVAVRQGCVVLRLLSGSDNIRTVLAELAPVYRTKTQYIHGAIPQIRIRVGGIADGDHVKFIEGYLRGLLQGQKSAAEKRMLL